jgi:Ulp1 family protease
LAAKGLSLCNPLSTYVTDELVTMQLQKTAGMNQIVTISKLHRMTFNPSTYVNNNVIDFWMAWLTHYLSDEVSSIVIFMTHFYFTLKNVNCGLDHVSRWTHQRNIDVFSKDILLFPICLDHQWSFVSNLFRRRIPDYWDSPYHNAWKNFLKKSLGKYATFGNEISYDKANMANKSSFRVHLICFNPMKPT